MTPEMNTAPRAAGKVHLSNTPIAYEPSRMAIGMARIASRVATITIGRISSASVSPAVRIDCPSPNW